MGTALQYLKKENRLHNKGGINLNVEQTFKAGVAITDISPEKGVELAGYPHFPRYNTGVHDPLYASCIYLDDESTKVAIVAMDLLFFSRKYVKEIRKRVEERTGYNVNSLGAGFAGSNIMFCCSHTHSGPWASGRLDLEALQNNLKSDEKYIEGLLKKVENIIIEAYNDTFDAKVYTGKAYCGKEHGVGGNRRDINGPSDPEVSILAVKDLKGNIKGCLIGYALHPTVIHSDSTVVSADYPAYIRNYLAEIRPDMVMLFCQGTSGNQSTRYFRSGQTFEEACRIGTAIGAEAGKVLESFDFEPISNMESLSDVQSLSNVKSFINCSLNVKSLETELELRKFPNKKTAEYNVEKAAANVEKLKSENASHVDIWNAELKLLGAEDILGYVVMLEKGIKPDLLIDEIPAEIQVIEIGDTRIVGLQGEIFVEFGLEIKNRSPYKNTFVFELANGAVPGYIYTRESLEEGGYETDTSMLSKRCGEIIVEKTIKLLNE